MTGRVRVRRAAAIVALVVVLVAGALVAVGGGSAPAAADANEAAGAPAAFRELSGGGSHACAIPTDGSLKCWGLNTQGQLGLGDNANRGDSPGEMGAALPAVDLGTGRTAVEVSAGGSHTCAVLDDGTLKCWGNNNLAQLGLGDTDNRGNGAGEMGDALPAVDLGTGRTAVAISAGNDHTCAVLDDGSVKCWGRGDVGQLGLGDTANRGDGAGEMGDALPAVDLGTGRTAVAISAGTFHTCALLDDGSVKCWGSGGNGRLGQGATTNVGDGPGEMGDALPAVSLGTGRTATAVAAANAGTCAVLDNASLKCWGLNSSGQLGLGDVADRGDGPGEMGDALPAVSLGTGRTAVGVSGGNTHTCAQLDNGSVKCWGTGASGRTGYGDTTDRGDGPGEMGDALPAVALGTDRLATAVTTAAASTCARLDTGTVKCWGQGSVGRLGLGDTADRGNDPGEMGDALPPVQLSAPPVPQPEPAASRRLSAGGSHTCAILANGSVKCWGDGALGNLGLGDTAHRGDAPGEMGGDLPTVDLGTGRTAVAIAAGIRHACAILDNGALKCWGQNAAGQLGLGDTAHRGDAPGEMGDALPAVDLGTGRTAVAVSIGLEYTCAVLDNGALKCWGANAVGQLGLGDAAPRGDGPGEMGDALPAVALGTGRIAVAVSASTGLTCALLDDGSVKCWGSGLSGALGQGSTANLGDGPGEMGDNLPAVNVGAGRTSVAITTGATHACVILDDGSVKCWGLSFEGGLGLGGTDARGDGPGEMGDALPAVALGTGRTAVAVDAGADHTCAVLDDATLKCWGRNIVGHLGLGDTANRGDGPGEMGDALPAVNLGTDRTPAAVSGGGAHTCVRLDDGNVKCWGYNQYGQLGLGDTANRGDGPGEMGDALPAVSLTGAGPVPPQPVAYRQLSGKGSHTCAILSNGSVKCWGDNEFGKLGLGDTADRGDAAGEMGADLPVVDLGAGRTAVAIAAGTRHTCAVLDNGQLKCWGHNAAGQLGLGDTANRGDGPGEMGDNLPAIDLGTGRTAVDVTIGQEYTCAVLDDGSVKCWGANNVGQSGLGDTANRGDGPGEMGDDLPAVDLGTGRTAVVVSASVTFTCALLDDGLVKCWGAGGTGALGQGNTANRGDGAGEMGNDLPAINLGTGRSAVAMTTGGTYACAVLNNGSVKCWGFSLNGGLGLGDTAVRGDGPGEMGDALPVVALGTGRTAVGVSAGTNHTCAVLSDGAVKCWGWNIVGQLGLGDTDDRGDGPGEMGNSLPVVALGTGRTAAAISAGSVHTCARLDDGNVKCWGFGGVLGLGDTAHRGDGPGEMGDDLPAVDLSAPAMTVVRTAGSSSVAVGDAIRVVVSVTNTGDVDLTGVTITDPTAAGCQVAPFGLATGANRTVRCTHTAAAGDAPVYDATASVDSDQTTPVTSNPLRVAVAGRAEFRQVSAGGSHSCAIVWVGKVKCWGQNDRGQLGLGDTANRGSGPGQMGDDLPVVDLGTGRTAVAITAGTFHTCALLDDASVKCWGSNQTGELGLGDVAHRGDGAGEMGDDLPVVDLGIGRTAVAISAAQQYTCALLDDGSVKCWGSGFSGKLGLGDTANRGDGAGEMGDALPAVALGTGRTAVGVAAGGFHACAVLDDGSVKCWGAGGAGALGQESTATVGDGPGEMGDALPATNVGTNRTVTAITAGTDHTCALLDDATVKCWGQSNLGQLGLGINTSRGRVPGQMGDALPAVDLGTGRTAVAVNSRFNHTCVVLDDGSPKCWGWNVQGQLGLGDSSDRGDQPAEMGDSLPAVALGTGRTAVSVVAGLAHTCALLDDAGVKCWGGSGSGQLGLGDTQTRGDGAGEMGDALPAVDLGQPLSALAVSVSADEASVAVGSPIHFHVILENTGDVPLTDVEVTSGPAAGCEGSVADLAVGAEVTVDCAYTPTAHDVGVLTRSATADAAEVGPVTSDDVSVDVTIPAGMGVVRGRVTALVFGNPIDGALVAGLDPADASVVGLDSTDGNGEYAMLVPAGSVWLYRADPAQAHIPGFHSTTPTVVGDGATVTIDTAMNRALGGIEGRITDVGSGDGVESGLALTTNAATGQMSVGAAADSSGFFVARDLRSVGHLVTMLDLSGAHSPRYYSGAPGGSASPAGASTVDVVGGALQVIGATGLPAQAAPGGTAHLTGSISGATSDVAVVALNAGDFSFEAGDLTDGSGGFDIAVDPGTYLVGFADVNGATQFQWYDAQPASGLGSATPVATSVGSPGVVTATLVSNRGTISGTVTQDGTGDPLAGVWALAIDVTGSVVAVDETAGDGTYTLADVPVGGVRVRFFDITGAHVPEYWDDHGGQSGADGYAAATVINVAGGATSTADAGLAPVAPPPPPVD